MPTQAVSTQHPFHDAAPDSGANSTDKNDQGGQAVTFAHVNSLKDVTVHAGKNQTLDELWNEATKEIQEPRRETDRLQAADGTDVMPYLSLTLRQLREQTGIKTRSFEIFGPTGGA